LALCEDHRRGRARYTGQYPPHTDCEEHWKIYQAAQAAAPTAPPAERVQKALSGTERQELVKLREDLNEARAELELYQQEYRTKPGWLKPPEDTKEHHGTLLAFLSDTHLSEVVDPDEMGQYNAFNLAIAEKRLAQFFDRTILVARHYLAGVHYDGLVLALGGDLVSGDIHEELTETNECSTYEAVEWAVPRLRAGVEKLAEEVGRVHVVSAPGNHGRNTKTPRHKKRSVNNADSHIARLLAQHFEGQEGISFDVPKSMDVNFEIYGFRFTMEHGDQFKGGDGQVGALGPVKRGVLRKQQQAAEEERPFKYMLVGHFHQYVPAASQGFLMNGSLKGYDEYARAWHFKPEPAQQALAVVTPEHGITMQAPVLVQKRSDEDW